MGTIRGRHRNISALITKALVFVESPSRGRTSARSGTLHSSRVLYIRVGNSVYCRDRGIVASLLKTRTNVVHLWGILDPASVQPLCCGQLFRIHSTQTREKESCHCLTTDHSALSLLSAAVITTVAARGRERPAVA